jgi:RNA polymerase sigma-70 factor (ECF subfamily)
MVYLTSCHVPPGTQPLDVRMARRIAHATMNKNPITVVDATQATAAPLRQCSAPTMPPASGRRRVLDDPDAALMQRLYDEHAAALWRYAVRLTGDRARAEDVVQETLLRAWQHPEVTGGHERSARAWLFTVARNMIIDDRRSARFRNESASPDLERIHDRAGPDEVDSAVDRLLLSGALAQLSPAHRAVIQLSYYQGRTTAQIAADLDVAEGTVRSRLHYAVRALRLTLQEMGYSSTRNS